MFLEDTERKSDHVNCRELKKKKKLRGTRTNFRLSSFNFIFEGANTDADDELLLWYGWPTKLFNHINQPGPLSEILTIANLWYAASRIWTCAEPDFRLCRMNLCSSDNHYTTASRGLSGTKFHSLGPRFDMLSEPW